MYRFLGAAFRAEFTRHCCAAGGTHPAVRFLRLRLFRAAFRAEFTCHSRAAGTSPGVRSRGRGSRRGSLLAHLEQCLGICAARLAGHIHPHERHSGTGTFIGSSRLHGLRLCTHQMGCRHVGVAEHRIALQLLDHGLVFLGGFYGGHAKRHNLHTAKLAPFFGEHIIQRIRKLHGVAGQSGIPDTHIGNPGKGRLQGGQQLCFQLAVNLGTVIGRIHIAADIGIEQDGIGDPVAVLAKAPDGNIHIQSNIPIHYTERYRRRRPILIAYQLLGVKIVHSLVLWGLSTKGKSLADVFENGRNRL